MDPGVYFSLLHRIILWEQTVGGAPSSVSTKEGTLNNRSVFVPEVRDTPDTPPRGNTSHPSPVRGRGCPGTTVTTVQCHSLRLDPVQRLLA